ncbi:MAG: hypothetical protein O3A53_06425 [Acidobacteria bacterium]|nr:hypothetical protein [Acidobacteriota bacterium]MDA1234417.1 hypothetical protein [Acidobacteriota bacterium]
MRRRFVPLIALLFGGAALLLAAGFWEKKGPQEWTNEEVETILTDSPWAQIGSISFVGDKSQPIGGGSRGGGIGFPGSRSPTSGPAGRSGQPDGGWSGRFAAVGSESRAFGDGDVVVRWSSALPIRQALERTGAGDSAPRPELLRDYYVVSLSRIPPGMVRLADEPEKLRSAARLTPKGRASMRAARIEIRPQPGTPGIDLYFPRETEPSAEDRQIVFELVAEDYELKAKFKPRDMIYHGKMEF